MRPPPNLSLPLVLLGAALLQACGDRTRTMPAEPPICADCLTEEVALGDIEGPGYVVHTEWLVRDSVGRYWLGQYRDMVKVFDARGTYLRTVGRFGQGPTEFGMPMPYHVDGAGNVHIIDIGNRRKAVVTPDFEFLPTEVLPFGVTHVAGLPDGDGFVASIGTRIPTEPTRPLYVIRAGEVSASMGMEAPSGSRLGELQRTVAVSPDGTIYATRRDRLSIGVYTAGGDSLASITGPDVRAEDPPVSEDIRRGAPVSAVTDLAADGDGHLLALVLRPREGWADHVIREPLQSGGIGVRPVDDDISKMYRSEILVFDVASARIVERIVSDALLLAFVAPDRLAEARTLDSGVPQVVIWRLTRTDGLN